MKDVRYLQAISTHLDLCDLFNATKFENYSPDTLDISALDMDDEENVEEEVY